MVATQLWHDTRLAIQFNQVRLAEADTAELAHRDSGVLSTQHEAFMTFHGSIPRKLSPNGSMGVDAL